MKAAFAFPQRAHDRRTTWWKRAGLIGFGFFFIKGLLWLTVPLLLYWLK